MISGYYISDPSALVSFPVARRYGSDDLTIDRANLEFETDRGKHWIYTLFTRYKFRLDFRVTLAQLATFETLDTDVGGNRTAFYFVPDVTASPLVSIYMRKEPGFSAKEYEGPISSRTSSKTRLYDYSLILTQEPTAAEILL